ncbi:MAG: hypothetical protein JSU86_13360 [Phycisphaerales bacterium]|nr:MAG: hypothetical protein JSU86_13360 [Phycisphaerales bacterium]
MPDADDIELVLEGVQGDFSNASLEAMDEEPPVAQEDCAAPNYVINIADVLAVQLASQGTPYPCPDLCDGVCANHEDCDDSVACTIDTCDEGVCANTPDDAACPDNGLFCDGEEVCDPLLDCVSTGNPCPPLSICIESTDRCRRVIEPVDTIE